jgi:AcrR family transcriptional regulator
MSTEKIPAREKMLQVAGGLFYEHGYRAIGIDRIIAESGVAKATFYNNFPSKDDLIVAWIRKAESQSDASLKGIEESQTPFFDYADRMIGIAKKSWCMGCTYQVTAAEFSDPSHPAHSAALDAKKRVIRTLRELAARQGIGKPEQAAEMVFLILEGVWASVRMFRSSAPLRHARLAVRLVASQARVPARDN